MANSARTKPGIENPEVDLRNPLEDVKDGYEKNKKRINTAVTIVLVAVVGL